MNDDLIVLVRAKFDNEDAPTLKHATGYFVAPDIILTARHVLYSGGKKYSKIKIRKFHGGFEDTEGDIWQSQKLDAALIKVNYQVEDFDSKAPTFLKDQLPAENEDWDSGGYPSAAKEFDETDKAYFQFRNFGGTLNKTDGEGQSKKKRLVLTKTTGYEPEAKEGWQGVSGAPVFVGSKLVGIIQDVPTKAKNEFLGVWSHELWKDYEFRTTLSGKKFEIPKAEKWLLLLNSDEKSDRVYSFVNGAKEDLNKEGEYTIDEIKNIHVDEIISDYEDFLSFIPLICRAPIMIFDVTKFHPATMLLLGIRAVVKRGITIALTRDPFPDDASKSEGIYELPFNIQEIKLIYMEEDDDFIKTLGSYIKKGNWQFNKNPTYLDLPPYDAIRNPVNFSSDDILFLCPFKDHEANFSQLKKDFSPYMIGKNFLRMLDIKSPQLVGQSLYEHIRWSKVCVIDWSKWRPNVFFELGVRLASSEIRPINIIEKEWEKDEFQYKQLINFFNTITYEKQKKPVSEELQEKFKNRVNEPAKPDNDIFEVCQNHYDWEQNEESKLPHEKILEDIYRKFGKERQSKAHQKKLFSDNEDYKNAIEKHLLEELLSAWFYLRHRYSFEEIKKDDLKKKDLSNISLQLSEKIQEMIEASKIRKEKIDERIVNLSIEINDLIDELE